MPDLSYKDILKELKGGQYRPVYFLQGEEAYFIDIVSDYIEDNALTDAEKGFNQTVLYGKDVEPASLIDTLMRYPMMAARQVVILKEAQDFRAIEKLEPYFRNPTPTTVFVVAHKYKKIRANSKLLKPVKEKGVLLTADKIKEQQLPAFIKEAAHNLKLNIPDDAVDLLMQYLGTDLAKIEKQLEKLSLNVEQGNAVTTADIEKYIGISKDYNVFEFTSAIAQRNIPKAFKIVEYFINNPKENSPIMVLGFLYAFFSKAYAYQMVKSKPDKEAAAAIGSNWYQVQDLKVYARNYPPDHSEKVIDLLMEYDLKAKGVDYPGSDKSVLLKELLFKMVAS